MSMLLPHYAPRVCMPHLLMTYFRQPSCAAHVRLWETTCRANGGSFAMMNCRVAGDGVRVSYPTPSMALPVFEHAAKLKAQAAIVQSFNLRIGAAPFLDDFH